jgi:hypothetical protein
MIAGAGRNHAAFTLGFAQRQQLIERTALLERTSALQILKLQVQGQTSELRKMMRKLAGRDVDRFADARARRLNAGQSDGFQNVLLNSELHKKKKATSRVCGWWPGCCWYCLDPVRQAHFPARTL